MSFSSNMIVKPFSSSFACCCCSLLLATCQLCHQQREYYYIIVHNIRYDSNIIIIVNQRSFMIGVLQYNYVHAYILYICIMHILYTIYCAYSIITCIIAIMCTSGLFAYTFLCHYILLSLLKLVIG